MTLIENQSLTSAKYNGAANNIAITNIDCFLSLATIVSSPFQPRHSFDPQALNALIESIKHNGIMTPLLVRPIGNEQYELVAGERRYRAAQQIPLEKVPVRVVKMSDAQVMQYALEDNLQRHDLNPVEETIGILKLLAFKLGIDQNSVISKLNKMSKIQRGLADNVIRPEDEQIIVDVFTTIGRFTPESFRVNRLPLLKLPNDVLAALADGHITYTKAKEVAKVKDETQRAELLENSIHKQWSLQQIKREVQQYLNKTESEVNHLCTNLENTYKQVKASLSKDHNGWQDSKKREHLQKLLEELRILLT